MPDVPWREVEPLPDVNGDVATLLDAVDGLKDVWAGSLAAMSPQEVRAWTLRRHAIETGIIERLYDVDWGTTETLVAEGLTDEVAAREGGLTPETLRIIRAQYDGLTLLAEVTRGDRPLSVHFVRELHQIITRHQESYEAGDQFGRLVNRPLRHGQWKEWPNHVRRADRSLLEYTPPEHVASQMDMLMAEFGKTEAAHPLIRAAWLHHRFIRIHPFEDGNGRVARALTSPGCCFASTSRRSLSTGASARPTSMRSIPPTTTSWRRSYVFCPAREQRPAGGAKADEDAGGRDARGSGASACRAAPD